MYIHPDFTIAGPHDLVLIELDSVVEFTDSIQPACLYGRDFDLDYLNSAKSLAGFGDGYSPKDARIIPGRQGE